MKTLFSFLFLLCLLTFGTQYVYAQGGGSTAFPNGRNFYYQKGNTVDLLHIDFYIDEADGDRLCHVMQNGILTFYEMTGVSTDGLEFRSVKFQPEVKMVTQLWGTFPQMTGRIINVDTGGRMTVVPGYSYVTINGKTYNKAISKEEYNRIFDQVYGNNSPTYIPGTGGNNSSSNSNGGYQELPSKHTSTVCPECHGSAFCQKCKNSGVVYNPNGGGYYQCPTCRGSGRCYMCHGTGRIN